MIRARRIKLQVFRAVVFLGIGAFFLIPLSASFEFSTRGNSDTAPRTMQAWANILQAPGLTDAISASLQLAVITSAGMLFLLMPTMVWVRLRLPQLNRLLEFICLLPLTIPAIALVVGLNPIFRWMRINVADSILLLAFAYLILVLPYSYRALDAGLSSIDIKTLSEAALSLGAGWATIMLRVIVPNISSALLNASILSVAVVLGEFTFANLMNFENFQVAINYIGLVSATTSIAVSLASLIFAFLLLFLLSFVGPRRARARKAPLDTQVLGTVIRTSAGSGAR